MDCYAAEKMRPLRVRAAALWRPAGILCLSIHVYNQSEENRLLNRFFCLNRAIFLLANVEQYGRPQLDREFQRQANGTPLLGGWAERQQAVRLQTTPRSLLLAVC